MKLRKTYSLFIHIILFFSLQATYSQKFQFKHYTTEDGLPHNITYQVIQDKKGYIWIGTDEGLARFDGTEFKTFDSSDGLLSNFIISLQEAPDSTIWIGSWKGGVNCLKGDSVFQPNIDEPLQKVGFLAVSENKLFLSDTRWNYWPFIKNNSQWEYANPVSKKRLFLTSDSQLKYERESIVRDYMIDKYGSVKREKSEEAYQRLGLLRLIDYGKVYLNIDDEFLYFGQFEGVWKYQNDSTFLPYFKGELQSETVYEVTQDLNKNYWVGGKGKIYRVAQDGKTKIFSKGLPNEPIHSIQLTTNKIFFLTGFLDLKSRGVYSYNLITHELIRLNEKLGLKVLPSGIKTDKDDNLWISTNGEGLYFIPNIPFHNYDVEDGLSNINIRKIKEDSEGNIIVGTQDGLYKFVDHHFEQLNLFGNTTPYIVNDISTASGNELLLTIEKETNQKTGEHLFSYSEGSSHLISGGTGFFNIIKSENNAYWYTDHYQNIRGCIELTKSTMYDNIIYQFDDEVVVNQLILLKDNRIGAATSKGFYIFKEQVKNEKLNLFLIDTIDAKDGLNNDYVNAVVKGKGEDLWLATKGGLCKYGRNKISCFKPNTGSVSNNFTNLIYGSDSTLWIGTPKGLVYFDGKYFRPYNHKTGLISSDINDLFLDSKKQLWIGTSAGVSVLDLSNTQKAINPPTLYIERLEINNEKVLVKNQIELAHDQNLRVYFKAINYNYPKGVSYEFRMNNNVWQNIQSNFIDFNSQKYDTYYLEIRAKSYSSQWSESRKLTFIVNPPFWWSWWAKLIYVLSFMNFIYGFVKWRSAKLIKEKKNLERIVAERTNELEQQKEEISTQNTKLEVQTQKLLEMDKVKSNFFANISHEFRTPLTLILGPIENLLSRKNDDFGKRNLDAMNRNANRLLRLINQLLDLSKIEANELILNPEKKDIIYEIKAISDSFSLLAKQKNIIFEYQLNAKEFFMWFDPEKLEIILNNLLSNALKFTPPKSKIYLNTLMETTKEGEQKDFIIKIKDEGVGIPEDKINHIFDRFYQVDNSFKKKHEGTGIGLSLTKELVALHGGAIKVESAEGKGSVFIVHLPLSIDQNEVAEFKGIDGSEEIISEKTHDSYLIENNEEIIELVADTSDVKSVEATVLIVEDNEDLRVYIEDLLKDNYNVKMATNGLEGLESAKKNMPDLIISDIMMPEMSGIELCEQLKTDRLTSHIPVVLLTAKVGMESKLEGLETGADDYLTKPFNKKELLVRVSNLIQQRKKLRERFGKELNLEPKAISTTSLDEKFLNNAIEVIEENMQNFEFSVQFFAKEMAVSRAQLHKKLTALTNQSPSEFNRTIRLKRAASLLKQKSGNIADVSFQVGFNSQDYFGKCFTKLYGISPSKYVVEE